MKTIIAVSLLVAMVTPVLANSLDKEDTIPTIKRGAEIFVERCSLCHGNQAMGEGKLALKLKDYPSTNLMKVRKAKDLAAIRDVVVYGGILDDFSYYMPPFGNELTWTEIESVSMFIEKSREDPTPHLALLRDLTDESSKSKSLGRETFSARCTLCHGVQGKGDGRMARIIKNPPPFDLTNSVMPKEYLTSIIQNGGESLGRSPQMPPWGDQLSQKEIAAVVDYITELRN